MLWEQVHKCEKDFPLHLLYALAIELAPDTAAVAMDFGQGAGLECMDLLCRGYEVHAINLKSNSIEMIKTQANGYPLLLSHLSSWKSSDDWPEIDFLIANHSFPECSSENFEQVIKKAIVAIRPQGIFAASFYGMKDRRVRQKEVTGMSMAFLDLVLQNFSFLYFDEIHKEDDHLIEVIAQAADRRDVNKS